MKKILALLFLLFLSLSAWAIQYQPIIYGSWNKGLNLNTQTMLADPDELTKLDNWYVDIDRSSTQRLGVLSKTLDRSAYKTTMPSSGRGRGLFPFTYYTVASSNLFLMTGVASTDNSSSKMLALDISGNAWYQLTGQGSTDVASLPPYHYSFVQSFDPFRGVDTVYFCNGTSFYKWFAETSTSRTELTTIENVGITPLGLSGTVYFINSTIVTGEGTSFLTEAHKGRWIRANSSATWYEVQYTSSNTELRLRNSFSESPTKETNAQRGALHQNFFYFIVNWKNRLWGYDGNGSFSRLSCSAALSSTTPAAFETWSGTDAGFVEVPGEEVYGTGLVALEDYLFCFKDTNYSVYRYDSSVVPPISLVKTWDYGCSTPRTICRIDNGFMYLSGNDVRYTTGFQDVSVAGQIKNYLRLNAPTGSLAYYYQSAANDSNFPCAIYDEFNKQYHLYFPDQTGTTTTEVTFDWDRKIWIGQDKFNNVGAITKVYNTLTSAQLQLVYQPVISGNQLYSINNLNCTTATGEIQSADLMFGDPKRQKKIYWIEFWTHVPSNESVTFEANYYRDGTLALATPLTAVVSGGANSENMTKLRFNLNTEATYFRWRLRDIGYSNASPVGQTSLIGGQIAYDYITND